MRRRGQRFFQLTVIGGCAVSLLAGCGGSSGGGGGNTNPTITSVTVAATPSSITTGQTSTCTATVSGTGSYSTAVTWTATDGTISGAGNTATLTPSGAGTATCVATSTEDSTKSGSASVTVAAAVTVTSVSVTVTPSSIQAGATAQAACVVTMSDGSTNSDCGGFSSDDTAVATVNATTGAVTAVTAGTAHITATSTADSTKSGSATLTVTAAVPAISAISPSVIYLDGQGMAEIAIKGSGFAEGDSVNITSPGSILLAELASPTEIDVELNFDAPNYSPGWLGITVCEPDGTTCSATENVAFIGNQNTLAVGPDGELYENDQAQGSSGANGYIRKFKVNVSAAGSTATAVADGSYPQGLVYTNSVDNKTDDLVSGRDSCPAETCSINNQTLAADDGNGNDWIGQAAENGQTCATRPFGSPTANLLSCFPVGVNNAPMADQQVGLEPWTVAMGSFSGTTYAYVYSRKTNPVLTEVDASDANPVNSYQISDFTDSASIPYYEGGWEIQVFDDPSGPAVGTIAILSNYNKTLVFVNQATMTEIGKPVVLSGNPIRIGKDEVHGDVIVEYANPSDAAHSTSSFAKVAPTPGTVPAAVTPLASTSALLGVGFHVSSDGNWLYVCQRDACDVQPNQ